MVAQDGVGVRSHFGSRRVGRAQNCRAIFMPLAMLPALLHAVQLPNGFFVRKKPNLSIATLAAVISCGGASTCLPDAIPEARRINETKNVPFGIFVNDWDFGDLWMRLQ